MWWSILELVVGAVLFIGNLVQDYGLITLGAGMVLLVFWSTQPLTKDERTPSNYGKRLFYTTITIFAMVVAVAVVVLIFRLAAELLVNWLFPEPNFEPKPRQDDDTYGVGDIIEYILRHLGSNR